MLRGLRPEWTRHACVQCRQEKDVLGTTRVQLKNRDPTRDPPDSSLHLFFICAKCLSAFFVLQMLIIDIQDWCYRATLPAYCCFLHCTILVSNVCMSLEWNLKLMLWHETWDNGTRWNWHQWVIFMIRDLFCSSAGWGLNLQYFLFITSNRIPSANAMSCHPSKWQKVLNCSLFLYHVFSRCTSSTGLGCAARGSRCAVTSSMPRPGSCRRPSPSGWSEEGEWLERLFWVYFTSSLILHIELVHRMQAQWRPKTNTSVFKNIDVHEDMRPSLCHCQCLTCSNSSSKQTAARNIFGTSSNISLRRCKSRYDDNRHTFFLLKHKVCNSL